VKFDQNTVNQTAAKRLLLLNSSCGRTGEMVCSGSGTSKRKRGKWLRRERSENALHRKGGQEVNEGAHQDSGGGQRLQSKGRWGGSARGNPDASGGRLPREGKSWRSGRGVARRLPAKASSDWDRGRIELNSLRPKQRKVIRPEEGIAVDLRVRIED